MLTTSVSFALAPAIASYNNLLSIHSSYASFEAGAPRRRHCLFIPSNSTQIKFNPWDASALPTMTCNSSPATALRHYREMVNSHRQEEEELLAALMERIDLQDEDDISISSTTEASTAPLTAAPPPVPSTAPPTPTFKPGDLVHLQGCRRHTGRDAVISDEGDHGLRSKPPFPSNSDDLQWWVAITLPEGNEATYRKQKFLALVRAAALSRSS